jgi:hypothetical protein
MKHLLGQKGRICGLFLKFCEMGAMVTRQKGYYSRILNIVFQKFLSQLHSIWLLIKKYRGEFFTKYSMAFQSLIRENFNFLEVFFTF